MKTRILIIIGLIGFLSLISIAQAVPELTFDDAYDYSKLVIVGQIESVEIFSEPYIGENISRSGIALYDVTILFSLKNPENLTEITVPGKYLREPHAMAYETYPFEVGQVVVLFIQPNDYVPGYDLVIRSANSEVIYPAIIYPNLSVGDRCEVDRYSYYNGYCMRVEIQNQEILNDPICGPGTELVNGICHLIKSDGPTHTKPSIFLDGFIFLIFFSPFFIPGSVIFIVLSKTPRYSGEIRITVCIAAILVLLYFLWSLSVGLYPPGYA